MHVDGDGGVEPAADGADAVLKQANDLRQQRKWKEAAALLAQPSDANARKLIDAIAGKDLSAQVKLPAPGSYK